MLVLTRKIDESITIGDAIEVRILDIKGSQIKLGVSAPRHIQVHRTEIYHSILEENRRAAMSADHIDQLAIIGLDSMS